MQSPKTNSGGAPANSAAESRPWLRWYGKIPAEVLCPEISLYEALQRSAKRFPQAIAWEFFDTQATYSEFLQAVDKFAAALADLGLTRGERILIAMPTSPEGVAALYAVNKIGCVAAFVHPLFTTPELEHCLNETGARIVISIDSRYRYFADAKPRVPIAVLILAKLRDYLSPWKRFFLSLKDVHHDAKIPTDPRVKWWRSIVDEQDDVSQEGSLPDTHDPAVIMFSAGTTGTPKGIVLSSYSFIAEGTAALAWMDSYTQHSIFAAMPIFHGFGLSLCVNAAFMVGGRSILVPTPNARVVADLLKSKQPNIILGVPNFYRSLVNNRGLKRADLSCLHLAFSGGDFLPRATQLDFQRFISDRGSRAKLLQGYGLTETVSAIIAMPPTEYREGSIGIPFPNMAAKICKIGTETELPPGNEGEICVSGPSLMLGYLNDGESTARAMHTDADGRVWLHTGDLGTMDADGFFYFKERLKRVIKSSGFNVFPSEVEAVLCTHPLVEQCCVIGISDEQQGERVVAYVVLGDKAGAGSETSAALIEYCRSRLIKWSCPRDIEFVPEFPQTRLRKVDYRALKDLYSQTHTAR